MRLLAFLLAGAIAGFSCAPAGAQDKAADAGGSALGFSDVSLAQALALAEAASPDIRQAAANVDGADASLRLARQSRGIAAVAGYNEQPQGGAPTTLSQRIGNAGLQITLGDVAAYQPQVVAAEAASRASRTDRLTAIRAEKLKVIGLYYAALKARDTIGQKNDALVAAEAFEEDVRTHLGEKAEHPVTRLDLLRAQLATAKARADAANAAAADGIATDALARELDVSPDKLRSTTSSKVPNFSVLSPDTAVRRALANRAELLSADENVRSALAAVEGARRAYFPPITLGAGYNSGVDGGTVINGPTLSASVSVPLGGVITARLSSQVAALAGARAKRDAVARAAALEVTAAARTAAATLLVRSATADARAIAKSAVSAAEQGFFGGSAGELDVDAARSAADQAVSDDISAQYDLLQAEAVLDVEMQG